MAEQQKAAEVGQSGSSNESPTSLKQQGKCPTCGDVGLWTGNFAGGPNKRVPCPGCGK
jgi:endogenous inhibitor of DNA gyrase (YacG/DUF329 family)